MKDLSCRLGLCDDFGVEVEDCLYSELAVVVVEVVVVAVLEQEYRTSDRIEVVVEQLLTEETERNLNLYLTQMQSAA